MVLIYVIRDMQLIVLANAEQGEALLSHGSFDVAVTYINEVTAFAKHKEADAYIDLEFVNDPHRNALLAQLLPKPVVINSVTDTLPEINEKFVRINGWTTFLSSAVLEASCKEEALKPVAEQIFSLFGKELEWLPDEPGFITPRVVSMIINEAFIALEEGVSTREEINTAMKLGTAYPYGPFEWAEKIGVKNIILLLQKLSEQKSRYTPSPLLLQEMHKLI